VKSAVEMDSTAMIYTSDFIKTGSGVQKHTGGHTQLHRQHGERITLFLFFSLLSLF
jgi:hypothetical protein